MSGNLSFLQQDSVKFTKKLDFGEFNEVLEENFVNVWLNVDAEFWGDWARYNELQQEMGVWLQTEREREERTPDEDAAVQARLEEMTEELLAASTELHARLWGCTPAEARQIYDISSPLFKWASEAAFQFIKEYNQGRKKG